MRPIEPYVADIYRTEWGCDEFFCTTNRVTIKISYSLLSFIVFLFFYYYLLLFVDIPILLYFFLNAVI